VDTLLRAAALVVREDPAFRLEIAGDGVCLPALRVRTAELGLGEHVRFLGEVRDVPGLLARASLFVLSSLTEGISLTLLEAMARGLPVVEFSFSGLKTAVARLLERRGVAIAPGLDVPTDAGPLTRQEVADFCASFQRVVVETLIDRTFDAARQLGAKSIGIAGGVSANSRLRRDAVARGEREGLPVFIPALALSTDNAAMIAAAGLRKLERGETSPLDFTALATIDI